MAKKSVAVQIAPDTRVNLRKIDPDATGGFTKPQAETRFAKLAQELGELQELLYAAQQTSLLIVLQGIDTSGKDGTIRSVFRAVNPLGCRVVSFKVPTPIELAHDFLWRLHPHAPEPGIVPIFNRSHYEDVLVVRIHELAPEHVWKARYEHINAFERLITDGHTTVLKFYLHISEGEQKE